MPFMSCEQQLAGERCDGTTACARALLYQVQVVKFNSVGVRLCEIDGDLLAINFASLIFDDIHHDFRIPAGIMVPSQCLGWCAA
jgi:hypothetical protein